MDISRIHAMKESLTEWAKSEIDKGKDCVCTEEMGEVIDMIKDLAEAEEKCYEAKYYKAIVEAMEDAKDDDDRRFYDNWRYSSGRFAPKGHGHRTGYIPERYDPMMTGEAAWANNYRMGYGEDWRVTASKGDMDGEKDHRGYETTPYDRYKEAKRHYTETHSTQDKGAMDEHAKKHLDTSIASFREIWQDADPEMKRRMKANLAGLVNEMNV